MGERDGVDHSKQNKVLFGEQRRNVAYFLKILRSWNATSLVLISALDDILEDLSLYLRVEKTISEGVARTYCYSVKRFVKWTDTLNPEKKHAMKYYDALLKERKKASTIGNILCALEHYYQFIGKELI